MTLDYEVRSIEEALSELGVTYETLNAAEKIALDELGYLTFPGLIDPHWLNQLRQTYEDLMTKEGGSAGKEVHQEAGTRRLADLVNKGEIFDRIYTHPKVLAAVYHIVDRDFKLSSLNGRDALSGYGRQAFHADWGARVKTEPFSVVNSVWLLDDFTPQNGATRFLPGSHLLEGSPKEYLNDLLAPHPNQALLILPAGSVAIFNAHLWHGGTNNHSQTTRRALHCYYTAREHPQQLHQAEYLRKKTYDRLSKAVRYILDV